jgi:hypothetical protein
MGSQALYTWAHDNPALELRGSDFTNDPRVIAENDQMVSVNSALAIDLTGQVAADTVRGKFFSGIGGQVDFVRGAARSRGGRSIIALRSTAQRGTVSRIQAAFEGGAGIVTSRGDVRFVVTEYGVADLWGKSVRERALALIEIAHPSFRAELLGQAKERRYVFVDQNVPSSIYPWREHTVEKSQDGVDVIVRAIRLSDEEALQDLLDSLSDESSRRRIMAHETAFSHAEIQRLVDADHVESMALVASEPRTGELIAMARYDMNPATRFGDIAFAVRDDWRRRGIGRVLMRRLLGPPVRTGCGDSPPTYWPAATACSCCCSRAVSRSRPASTAPVITSRCRSTRPRRSASSTLAEPTAGGSSVAAGANGTLRQGPFFRRMGKGLKGWDRGRAAAGAACWPALGRRPSRALPSPGRYGRACRGRSSRPRAAPLPDRSPPRR